MMDKHDTSGGSVQRHIRNIIEACNLHIKRLHIMSRMLLIFNSRTITLLKQKKNSSIVYLLYIGHLLQSVKNETTCRSKLKQLRCTRETIEYENKPTTKLIK
jgi:hypothetical protein